MSSANDSMWKEYGYIFKLEEELNRTRWIVFTTFLSISFVIGGLVLNEKVTLRPLFTKLGMSFGWMIFMAGFYHYRWFHNKAHDLRDRMCELEELLSISVFRIRTRRPTFLGIKIFYHWAINVMAVAYSALLVLVFILY